MEVAMKEMKFSGIEDETSIEEIRREVDVMKRLRSPYIVTFYGSVVFLFFPFFPYFISN